MKSEATEFLPLARRDAIISKEVDGELLVYDRERDRAHCLNETAAAVWKLCDGQSSVSAIAARVSGQWAVGGEQKAAENKVRTGSGSDGVNPHEEDSRQKAEGSDPAPDTRHLSPDVVWLALDQLRRSHLLEEMNSETAQHKTFWPPAIAGISNMSRREAVRRIGLGAAIALPIVISMTAPTAVQASVSCGATCHPCSTPADCCGVCSSSVPSCPAGNRCT